MSASGLLKNAHASNLECPNQFESEFTHLEFTFSLSVSDDLRFMMASFALDFGVRLFPIA